MAEAVKQEQSQTGENISETWFGLLAITNKVGYALAIGTAYPLLDALVFSAQKPAQGTVPLLVVYALLPAICFVGSVLAIGRVQGTPKREAVSIQV